ncbi:hypothetical protein, partial [Streptomyces sp. NPDC047939]|uniref:hypothetical protein n=1 Tax=Streptomyces sp. NPDC047939 TaxID=3155381 RepID=UPI00341972A2
GPFPTSSGSGPVLARGPPSTTSEQAVPAAERISGKPLTPAEGARILSPEIATALRFPHRKIDDVDEGGPAHG